MAGLRISKNPDDYRYVPPPARTRAVRNVGIVLLALVVAAPAIIDVARDWSWDHSLPSVSAVLTSAAIIVGRRLVRTSIGRFGHYLRRRVPRLTWSPSKNPDDYR